MKSIARNLCLAILLCSAIAGCDNNGATNKPMPIVQGIQCSLDEGFFISDDIYFTNSSGKDLTEVHITMTLTGETGATKQVNRYWSYWHLGDKKQISLATGDSVIRIQRIDISGKCDQGSISNSWIKK